MENILLQVLQEIRKQTPASVAAQLGISLTEYLKIETGKTLMTEQQADQLGKLFNVKSKYIYKAALQLELLMVRSEMLKIQTGRVEELREKMKRAEKRRKR